MDGLTHTKQMLLCIVHLKYGKKYTVETYNVYYAKSEQCYHLTSSDAEEVAVRLLLPLHRKRLIQ